MAVVVIVDLPFFLIYPLSPSSRDQVVMVDTGAEKEAEGEEGHEVSRLRWCHSGKRYCYHYSLPCSF